MPKVAVILSGCGVNDGSEIHESVITILALDRANAEIVFAAPDIEFDVVNHLTGEPTGEKRNVLVESARIARGNIKNIKEVDINDIDAAIFPGGFGAAKNLCDYAIKGADCTVNPDVKEFIEKMQEAKKPLGFICIAPVIAAKLLNAKVTIGNDKGTIDAINTMGGSHEEHLVNEIAVDEEKKVVSTPAYMCARSIKEAASGIEALVNKILELAS